MKPIMNLDEAQFDDVEENGYYTSKRASISDHIGARKLGYNLTVLPPGKAQCPFQRQDEVGEPDPHCGDREPLRDPRRGISAPL